MSAIGRLLTAGGVAAAVGLVRVRAHTPRCSNFDVKVQFAASDRRLARWLGTCPVNVAGARRALRWDYLLLGGYGTALAGGLLLLTGPRGRLPRWMVALPVAAALADGTENALLLRTLGERDGRFAFPPDSVRPALVTVAASVKFTLLIASIKALGYGMVRAAR